MAYPNIGGTVKRGILPDMDSPLQVESHQNDVPANDGVPPFNKVKDPLDFVDGLEGK